MRVLFSRNFAYAKFRENKTSRNGENTLSFTDIDKSCPSRRERSGSVVECVTGDRGAAG